MARLGNWRGGLKLNLTLKLAIALIASFTALVALFGYLSLHEHQRHSEALILVSADRITDLIQRSTRYQMLHNDRNALYEMINNYGSGPGMRRVRIFNEDGRISFSTDPSEVNKVVDKKAEACYACHAQAAPLARLDRPDRSRIFSEPGGGRVLGIIRPIENEPACSNSTCHAHPAERRILGVIDANLSLAAVDAQLAEYRTGLLWLTGLAVLVAALVSVAFILLVVHRPVTELMAGIKEVADGDLDHVLPVRSGDELGRLASSFNTMTADLRRARDEITAWAQTLEQRVEEKSHELEKAYTGLVVNEKMASLGKLAATVAHEVNNPLFGILTYSRLVLKEIEKGELSDAARAKAVDQLRTIERESNRCGGLMRNLLTFARQAPPRKELHDLNLLLGRALKLTRHQADLQGVELVESLGSGLPPCLCDGDQVQQVCLALLVNALDVMPRGGRLDVSTRLSGSGAAAEIRIRDNGPGIPEDVLPQIFEPFFTTKEDQHRTGLGLAVARSIAEHHGGSLTVQTKPDSGAEFTLTLPLGARVAVQPGATEGVHGSS
ncbi:MAG: HAMP domain-containing protein [Bryobacterales bacterium]|nr:HAMP domain-containing protein [Bryobacterales bacterium]